MTHSAILVALSLLAPPQRASGPTTFADPVAVVRAFYARDSVRAYEFYSPRLRRRFLGDRHRAEAGVGNLDFTFYVNAQVREKEWEKTLRIELISRAKDRVEVRASFRNFGPQEIHYTLVHENGRWLIDDARSVRGDRWVLSEILG